MLKNKRDFKVVSPSGGGLSKSEIEKLYKLYSSIDGKHKQFKGSKEEYVSTLSGMVKNFLNGVYSTNLQGAGKKSATFEKKISKLLGKTQLHLSSDEDSIKKARKIADPLLKIYNARNKLEDYKDSTAAERKIAVNEAVTNLTKLNEVLNFTGLGFDAARLLDPKNNDAFEAFTKNLVTFVNAAGDYRKYKKEKPGKREESARKTIKKLFPDEEEIFNPIKQKIRGKVPVHNKETGEYSEEKTTAPILNPFFRATDSFLPTYSSDNKYKELVDDVVDARKIIKSLLKDVTAQKNFIIALPFKNIFKFTPEGIIERQQLNDLLLERGRPTNAGLATSQFKKPEWSQSTEASFRTEYFVFFEYLSNKTELTEKQKKIEEAGILGKIFSFNLALAQLDYDFPNIKADSKGKKTLGEIGKSKDAQVNLDKITALINSSYNRSKDSWEAAEVLYTYYKSDAAVCNYDETKKAGLTSLSAIQAVFKFDIKKMMTSTKPGCQELVTQIKDLIRVPAATPKGVFKQTTTHEIIKAVRDLFFKYITRDVIVPPKIGKKGNILSEATIKYTKIPAKELYTGSVSDATVDKSSCLSLDISDPDTAKYLETVVIANHFLNKDRDIITPYEFGMMMTSTDLTSKYNTFQGAKLDNYTVMKSTQILSYEFEEAIPSKRDPKLSVPEDEDIIVSIGLSRKDILKIFKEYRLKEEEVDEIKVCPKSELPERFDEFSKNLKEVSEPEDFRTYLKRINMFRQDNGVDIVPLPAKTAAVATPIKVTKKEKTAAVATPIKATKKEKTAAVLTPKKSNTTRSIGAVMGSLGRRDSDSESSDWSDSEEEDSESDDSEAKPIKAKAKGRDDFDNKKSYKKKVIKYY